MSGDRQINRHIDIDIEGASSYGVIDIEMDKEAV